MADRDKEVIVTGGGGGSVAVVAVILLLLVIVIGAYLFFGTQSLPRHVPDHRERELAR